MKTRRDFLLRTGALSAGGLVARLGPLSILGLASASQAQAASDYKALVCVFLYGGVDANNLVVPIDAAGYAQYTAVRTVASGVNLAQAELLPIQPASRTRPRLPSSSISCRWARPASPTSSSCVRSVPD